MLDLENDGVISPVMLLQLYVEMRKNRLTMFSDNEFCGVDESRTNKRLSVMNRVSRDRFEQIIMNIRKSSEENDIANYQKSFEEWIKPDDDVGLLSASLVEKKGFLYLGRLLVTLHGGLCFVAVFEE